VIARAVASYAERGHGLWAMTLKGAEQVIGDCGLIAQEVEGVEETEIGYHIRRDFWGQGLATEAARACRDYGFERLGRSRLISMIRPENFPSRRVAEKNGMRIEREVFWRGFRHYVYVAVAQP
jgi:[ribosomal protein S5]-alanine N-acetyltransferase